MTRKDFLKNLTALGIASPFLSMLGACDKEDLLYPDFEVNFSGKVIIVGAGAAGLTAGYILNKYNIDFEILEAAPIYGGRIKRVEDFADFPIDLGGEWIHTDPSVLASIISDPKVSANVDVVTYNPQTIYNWKNEKLKKQNWASNFYSEYKFKNSTWFGFFDKYIVPEIQDRIILNSPVTEVNYSTDKVVVKTEGNTTYEADKILITAPVKILQSDLIQFIPSLPNDKKEALDSIEMGDGIKVFIEFKERFYPDILLFDGLISALIGDGKIFYNAAFGKDSNRNILGLFAINEGAAPFTGLPDAEIKDKILAELDEMFDGKATANFEKIIVQNWSKEPYIQGSYSEFQGEYQETIETLVAPLDNKVYFAGEACNLGGDTATVHGAAQSAYSIVERLLK